MRFVLIKIEQFRKWKHNRRVKKFNDRILDGFDKRTDLYNILTSWGIENNINDLVIQGTPEHQAFSVPIEMPTYTVRLDLNLPFKNDRIGVVIINGIQYVKKGQK